MKTTRRTKANLRRLYRGMSGEGVRFRYGLLAFDVVTLLYLIISSFFYGHPLTNLIDIVLGVLFLADLLARLWISRARIAFLAHPFTWMDVLVIGSLLIPLVGEHLAFMRIFRTLRLLRSYRMLTQLRRDFRYFRLHEDIIVSVFHLVIFLFVMTAVVFETQVSRNEEIRNYIDALYFTVTALTTTGFGDITLHGTVGKLISVVIMIAGVTLFIRLIQTIFRPYKVRFPCPHCGLVLHDADAVHCKHCGNIVNIPDEGRV